MELTTGNTLDIEYRPAGMCKYVLHRDIEQHKAAGWIVSNDMQGTHHGHYGVLMAYTGEAE
jgi:hypothetical protein